MTYLQTTANPTDRPAEDGPWRRLGSHVWRGIKSSGMARAAGHLDQVAYRYASIQPELADSLRDASKFADRLAGDLKTPA